MVTVRSLHELREALADSERVRIVGSGSTRSFGLETDATVVAVGLCGVVSHDADDQVVTAWGGTLISELQEALAERGQCLPWLPPSSSSINLVGGTLAGQLSRNLPHSLEAGCGTWRDWVLGLRLMLSDGTTAKTGSKAVKNVAGYDVQRLLIGAEGQLAVVTEVTIRTFPIKALPDPDFEGSRLFPKSGLIHRVRRSDFLEARKSSDVFASHPGTATLYRTETGQRFEHDWQREWSPSKLSRDPVSTVQLHYEARAKALFDPLGRFV